MAILSYQRQLGVLKNLIIRHGATSVSVNPLLNPIPARCATPSPTNPVLDVFSIISNQRLVIGTHTNPASGLKDYRGGTLSSHNSYRAEYRGNIQYIRHNNDNENYANDPSNTNYLQKMFRHSKLCGDLTKYFKDTIQLY